MKFQNRIINCLSAGLISISILLLASCHNEAPKPVPGPTVTYTPILNDSLAPTDSSFISLKNNHSVGIADLMSQRWDMDDVDQKYWNDFFWDSVKNKRQFPALDLFRDFSATENARTRIRMGTWKLDKEKSLLILNFPGQGRREYNIHELSIAHLNAYLQNGNHEVLVRFLADGLERKNPEDDPFYPGNNRWRIRPTGSESIDQIRERVKNYTHFFSLFYLDSYQRHQENVSYSGLPCCFNWFDGAIGLQDMLELDERWINCFYSKQEAWKGYEMIRNALNNNTLKWPAHKNWVYETGNVLQQLCDKL